MSGQVPSVGSLSDDDDDEPVFGRSLAQMVSASPFRCFPVGFTFFIRRLTSVSCLSESSVHVEEVVRVA